MPAAPYVRDLRARIGHDLLLLPSIAVMVFDERDRLLVVRSAETGEWQTVGGAIDPGESPADAAVREAREETGYEVALQRVIGTYGGTLFEVTYPNGDRCQYVAIVFEGRITGGTARPDHEETSEVAWITAQEAETLTMAPHTRFLLREAFLRDPHTRFGSGGSMS